jgi:hypothetical protein
LYTVVFEKEGQLKECDAKNVVYGFTKLASVARDAMKLASEFRRFWAM